jgi:hypothetical protein
MPGMKSLKLYSVGKVGFGMEPWMKRVDLWGHAFDAIRIRTLLRTRIFLLSSIVHEWRKSNPKNLLRRFAFLQDTPLCHVCDAGHNDDLNHALLSCQHPDLLIVRKAFFEEIRKSIEGDPFHSKVGRISPNWFGNLNSAEQLRVLLGFRLHNDCTCASCQVALDLISLKSVRADLTVTAIFKFLYYVDLIRRNEFILKEQRMFQSFSGPSWTDLLTREFSSDADSATDSTFNPSFQFVGARQQNVYQSQRVLRGLGQSVTLV